MKLDDVARSARPSLEQLAAEQGITRPATLETLPVVDVFDDGEVEQFLAFIAEERRASFSNDGLPVAATAPDRV